MTSIDWTERQLCDDGGCTGVISGDGRCHVCGRAAQYWGDERRRGLRTDVDDEPDVADSAAVPGDDDRVLCSDGDCTGVLGIDQRCTTCGKSGGVVSVRADGSAPEPAPAGSARERANATSDDDRRLCSDGSCVGLIGDDGRCRVCGRRGED